MLKKKHECKENLNLIIKNNELDVNTTNINRANGFNARVLFYLNVPIKIYVCAFWLANSIPKIDI